MRHEALRMTDWNWNVDKKLPHLHGADVCALWVSVWDWNAGKKLIYIFQRPATSGLCSCKHFGPAGVESVCDTMLAHTHTHPWFLYFNFMFLFFFLIFFCFFFNYYY